MVSSQYFTRTVLLHDCILNDAKTHSQHQILKCGFSSLLNSVSSQNNYFTYITDRCFPSVLHNHNVFDTYKEQIMRMYDAGNEFVKFFQFSYPLSQLEHLISSSAIHNTDSRNFDAVAPNSIDLVVTSPPYLCMTDYINSMRLTNLFFPEKDIHSVREKEIGPRRHRQRKAERVVNDFFNDMITVFKRTDIALKPKKYLALVFGQGSGKVTENINTVQYLVDYMTDKMGYSLIFNEERDISYRRIRVRKKPSEHVIVLQKG